MMPQLPYSLSHPMEQCSLHMEQGNWSKAMNYMLDSFEAGSQYVSIVLMGMLRDSLASSGREAGQGLCKVVMKIDGKRPLSFGDWCNDILPVLAQEAMETLPGNALVQSLYGITNKKHNIFLGGKGAQSIVQIRNEYKGHSTTLSEEIYREAVTMLYPRLQEFREAVAPLEGFEGEESLFPLIHKDEAGHPYIFQSLKEESTSFISVSEDALTVITDKYNDAFDTWMQAILPSFDIAKDLNWDEYTRLLCGMSSKYLGRIYSQKKYNRELFVEREALSAAYSDFIASDKTIFPLLGEAGQGKTNQLCHWTESLQEAGEAVITFSGNDFSDISLPEMLRNLFGLSKHKALSRATDHLHRLAVEQGRYVYVLFDAVNECLTYPGGNEIDEGVVKLFRDIYEVFGSQAYPRFKVLLTCRSYTWHQTVVPAIGNMDTSCLYRPSDGDVEVGGFSDSEVEKAYDIYGELYQMATPFSQLDRRCVIRLKDPLMLKFTCTNYLGKSLPKDNSNYCSIALFRHMMDDISSSYAGKRQQQILEHVSRNFLERYEGGEAADSLSLEALKAAGRRPCDPLGEVASLIFQRDGISVAYGELLNKPERPILRQTEDGKIQFVYERFLEFQLACRYFERETADLPEGKCIPVERIIQTLHKARTNEVFLKAMNNVIIMDYLRTGNAGTVLSLCRDYGDDIVVAGLVSDVMHTLVAENYEKDLFNIERLLLSDADAGTGKLVTEYNAISAKIGSNKAVPDDLARHKELSAQLSPVIRLRELASLTLINGIFLSDYYSESLYAEDPFNLLWQLMDEKISEVVNNACMYIYYISRKHYQVTEQIIRRMFDYIEEASLLRTVVSSTRRSRAVSFLETGVRLDVLLIIDLLLAGGQDNRDKVQTLLGEITGIFGHLTWDYRLIRILMPFFTWIMRRQLTFQSAYVNNVIEYQTFWEDSVVPAVSDAGGWSRKDLLAIAPFVGMYSGYYAPEAEHQPSEAPDFRPYIQKVLAGYETGDSLSYFAIERLIVILASSDWAQVEPLVRGLRDGDLQKSEWFDYSQMSIIYGLYQMGLKMPQMPDMVWEMLEDWCVDWTRRCRGYFKGHNSHKANPLQLYKRNVMTWYAKVYACRFGDVSDPERRNVPAFRMLLEEAARARDKELMVHLINNISEIVTDSEYINTALDLLKEVFVLIDSREVLQEFESNADTRYPDTSEDIVALVGKILGTAKNYFPAQVDHFLKKDVLNLSFPGLAEYRDEILGFNPGGEKLSDLFTHKFGNFVIWALIYEKSVDDVAVEILEATDGTPDCYVWFDKAIRIVFRHLFKVKL